MSATGLNWDAKFSLRKVKYELISKAHMYLFFKVGKKGWLSYNSKKYSKASSKCLESYDLKQDSKNSLYLEKNTLIVMQRLYFF